MNNKKFLILIKSNWTHFFFKSFLCDTKITFFILRHQDIYRGHQTFPYFLKDVFPILSFSHAKWLLLLLAWKCKCHQIRICSSIPSLSDRYEFTVVFLTWLLVRFKCNRFRKKLLIPHPQTGSPSQIFLSVVQAQNLSQPWFLPYPQPLNLVYRKFLLFFFCKYFLNSSIFHHLHY